MNSDFKGMFLGFREMDSSYSSYNFDMSHNDVLLLFTDCIVESKNEKGIEYGVNSLMKSFSNAPAGTAKEILDHITNDFISFMKDNELADDLTVLVLQKNDLI
jgi:sigma-B regulation protein RsbU (phosphoserine phosphatase)